MSERKEYNDRHAAPLREPYASEVDRDLAALLGLSPHEALALREAVGDGCFDEAAWQEWR